MINKRTFLTVLFAIVTISFLFTVSATVTVFTNSTLNGTNISGTHRIYFNMTGCFAQCHIGNISINWTYYNGTSFYVTTVSNVTENQTNFTYAWDTTTFPDGKNGSLNFTAIDYPSNATINATNLTRDINLDNTLPTMVVYGTAPTAYANTSIRTSTAVATANLTLSIYITDATKGMANSTEDGTAICLVNVGDHANVTVPMFNVGWSNGWCNVSNTNASTALNLSGLGDGNSTIRIYVNDSVSAGNQLNNTLVAHIDTTVPTSTATCSPTTAQTGDSFPCSCTGTDATSGVSTSTGTSTSPDGIVTPSSTGGFTYTCTVTDNGGLTASASKTYTIQQSTGSGSSSGGGSSGGATTPKPQVFSFTKITPGAATIVKNFDSNTGIKEIQITVNNEAQNVKVTVTKYDGKPAAVSVAKTGKVYQYMQINVSGVENKLSKAKVTVKVEKSWVTSNGVDKNNVVISKFDEANGKWVELTTTYDSEDTTYHYYDAEVTSFSYFATSEKAASDTGTDSGTDSGATGTSGTVGEGMSLTWLWIVIAVIVIALIIWAVARKK